MDAEHGKAAHGGGGARAPISFEEGWRTIRENGIEKLHAMIRQGNERAAGMVGGGGGTSNGSTPAGGATSSSHSQPAAAGAEQVSFTNEEYVALYTTIYEMCIQKPPYCYTSHLYEEYGRSISQYLQQVSYPAIVRQKGQFLLKELVLRWQNHTIMMRWMRDFFRYLDRFYVKRHSRKPLMVVGTTAFKTLVFDLVKDKATQAFLELVEQDRSGEPADRDLLKQAAQIYVEMGMDGLRVYEEELQRPLLEATEVFYTRECDRWLEAHTCPQHLALAEERFAEERARARDFLHTDVSLPRLMDVLYQTLLVRHQSDILDREDTGIMAMLRAHAEADLSRLFRVYSQVRSSLDPIAASVKEFIRGVGSELVTRVNADRAAMATFVEELIAVHDRYYDLVRTCFQGNSVFERALSEAFESVVNRAVGQTTTAELLASHADVLLRKGGTRMSDQQLQDTLDKVVRLFTYLTDKDMFSEVYRKQLARRLLMGRSASRDAESGMIGKLKLRCGAQFTSKLEGMINDMRQGEEHSRAFRAYAQRAGAEPLRIECDVQVLTAGFWPTYPTDEVRLAPVFVECIDAFKQYYNSKTSNRKLAWIHSLGQVTLAGNFPRKRVDLVVSTVQASILLLFNEYDELEITAISKHTGLSPEDTKKYLRSMVSGQARVLVKRPAEGYSVTHKIAVNDAFTHQQRRVRIPHVPSKSSSTERKQNLAAVTEDRKHSIEANIVRVMKARKTLNHQNLITEVSQQLMQWFRPDPRQIKRRIEDLIAREYLRRDAQDPSVYFYIA